MIEQYTEIDDKFRLHCIWTMREEDGLLLSLEKNVDNVPVDIIEWDFSRPLGLRVGSLLEECDIAGQGVDDYIDIVDACVQFALVLLERDPFYKNSNLEYVRRILE